MKRGNFLFLPSKSAWYRSYRIDPALRNKIENIEQMLKDFYDKRRQIKESEALENIKRNPKVFYAYAKKYSKSYSGIGPLVDEDGETLLLLPMKMVMTIRMVGMRIRMVMMWAPGRCKR